MHIGLDIYYRLKVYMNTLNGWILHNILSDFASSDGFTYTNATSRSANQRGQYKARARSYKSELRCGAKQSEAVILVLCELKCYSADSSFAAEEFL